MPVADTALLKSFLKQKLGISTLINKKHHVTGKSGDGRLTIAFNTGTFAAGYSFNGENVENIVADLVNKKNMLSDKDQKIVKLKALKSHLAYVFDGYTGRGNFRDGQLHLEGYFDSTAFPVNGTTFNHRVFGRDAVVKMWLNAKPSPGKSFSRIKIKNDELYPDSLLSYCNGYFDLEMGSLVSQTDTVITYVYNDNFEKEETLTPRVVKVPGISSVVAVDPGLLSYMDRVNLVDKGKVSKKWFPLYQLYLKQRQSAVIFSTDPHQVVSEIRESTPYFFYLDADFGRLKSQGQFPLFEKYVRHLKQLIVKARTGQTVRLKPAERNEMPEHSQGPGNAKGSHFRNRPLFQ